MDVLDNDSSGMSMEGYRRLLDLRIIAIVVDDSPIADSFQIAAELTLPQGWIGIRGPNADQAHSDRTPDSSHTSTKG
jgi:hypothetical protein